ncbi:RNA-binding S4 domain-containing protein [Alkalilimnicola sp. S0819]|uniref:RNA-binding S4 domain-containing protein n=1 Tax=Alkalilimnicola sp. S0819 TaxID=2613922 RepID=UPI0012626203|nr:S4 domain-containing protein [Alkalilimnicola sp. S0819]KAB7627645.1 RNA-binding protein [Alkalilimnicola sp. S0819]MPQ15810.1 RNA-binding protein [Alkalilimnicola sp. S0819]
MSAERVRLDKWLWAARFYKTRRLATEAAAGGKVQVNGQRAKPARDVQVGARLTVSKEGFEYELTVLGLSERRGPASQAQLLYEESAESRQRREALREQMRAAALGTPRTEGRPDKHDRRRLGAFKRGQGE